MPGKIQWISYQFKEILFNNRSGLRNNDIMENSKEAVDFIKSCGKKDILYLVDNSNTIIVPEVRDFIKKSAKEIDPYVKKTAVIGTNNAQRIMLNVYSAVTGMNIHVFDDPESAKKWLIK
jgi:hypothetical protein